MSEGQYSLEVKEYDQNLDLTKIKPYGDTMNDGKVQVSFTLPVEDNERGVEAALQLAKSMGLKDPNCAHHASLI